jgi:hypothetical protein
MWYATDISPTSPDGYHRYLANTFLFYVFILNIFYFDLIPNILLIIAVSISSRLALGTPVKPPASWPASRFTPIGQTPPVLHRPVARARTIAELARAPDS